MAIASTTFVDVNDIIAQGAVEVRLQPIPSIRRSGLIGVEALSRGFGPDGALEAPLFETTPYVPLPTQALCVTLSTFFHDADQSQRVLCIHMDGVD